MTGKPAIGGIVLAGGKSCRMGADKGSIQLDGCALVELAARKLGEWCTEVVISANDPTYARYGYRLVQDIYPSHGPMSGLYSALLELDYPHSVVLAADMPLFPSAWLGYLISESNGHEIVLPIGPGGFPEPLSGVYPRIVLPEIAYCLENGLLAMQALLQRFPVRCVRVPSGENISQEDAFLNVNTPKELEKLASWGYHTRFENREGGE